MSGQEELADTATALPTWQELQAKLVHIDDVFAAWVQSLPDKHWITTDLSALRVGYELGKAVDADPSARRRRRRNNPA